MPDLRDMPPDPFKEDGVEFQSIPDAKGRLDKLFDKLPDLIEKITEATSKAKKAE